MPHLLVAHGLSKRYIAGHGRAWARVQVLTSVSLCVQRGERVVITAARGAGKTTLLHCLTGLRRPDTGSVRWDASRGVPYCLCADWSGLARAAAECTLLAELPEEPAAAGAWLELLDARPAFSAGWIVLTSRPEPLRPLADRVLELRDGTLRPLKSRHPLRVAEGA